MGSGTFGGIYFAQYAHQYATGDVPTTEIAGTYEPLMTVAGAYELTQNLPGQYEPVITLEGEWE
jgi:hypothetical protein